MKVICTILIILSFRFAEGQTVDAIRFVYREVYHKGYANLPHGTLTIYLARPTKYNDETVFDPNDRSVVLTDIKTYNFLREYVLCSNLTYTAKDAEKAKKTGMPVCSRESSLEIIGSGGMDVFLCRDDWRTFFDTLRSALRIQSVDARVTAAFDSAPDWPMPVTVTRKLDCLNCRTACLNCEDTLLHPPHFAVKDSIYANAGNERPKTVDTGRIKVELDFEKALAQYDFAEVMRLDYRSEVNLPYHMLLIGTGKRIHPNEIVVNRDLSAAVLTDTGTFNLIREYLLSSSYTYTAKDVEKSRKAGKPMCPLEISLEMADSGGMDLFVCRDDWQALIDSLQSVIRTHLLDSRSIDLLKWRLF